MRAEGKRTARQRRNRRSTPGPFAAARMAPWFPRSFHRTTCNEQSDQVRRVCTGIQRHSESNGSHLWVLRSVRRGIVPGTLPRRRIECRLIIPVHGGQRRMPLGLRLSPSYSFSHWNSPSLVLQFRNGEKPGKSENTPRLKDSGTKLHVPE